MSDFFADTRTLVERSPLTTEGTFRVCIRYSLDQDSALFEMNFIPKDDGNPITAKWIIDLLKMSEEGDTHRELVKKGLDAIHEAYRAQH
jgi:hypothetical protein